MIKNKAEEILNKYREDIFELNNKLFDLVIFGIELPKEISIENLSKEEKAIYIWIFNKEVKDLEEEKEKLQRESIRFFQKLEIAKGEKVIYKTKGTIDDDDIDNAKLIPISDFHEFDKSGMGQSIYKLKKQRTPSMKYWPEKNIFKCFYQGEGGDVIKFVMDKDNLDFISAVKKILNV